MESQSAVVEKLNEENYGLYKQLDTHRRQIESLQVDILLNNQILEENRIKAI